MWKKHTAERMRERDKCSSKEKPKTGACHYCHDCQFGMLTASVMEKVLSRAEKQGCRETRHMVHI